ncbi:isochorismate synthase [Liquorilactobacillus mali]|uniref:isochorismate synthase n=1 Tax=Liquorilactobacillus mali TaxID=1618 RepID=UPI002350B69C|nr:isochorismate synthase [Liquorilactobacillus mali]MDC7952597.1 isochorismate synthase [Liquorilactobacillus mali]
MSKKIYYTNSELQPVDEKKLIALAPKYDNAFIFQTPEGLRLYSFGSLSQITPGSHENQFTAVSHWKDHLHSLLTPINAAVPPQVVGGFSFSSEQTGKSVWGDLSNGYFFLPKYIVIIENNNFTLITSSFNKTEITQEKIAFISQLSVITISNRQLSNAIVAQKELNVDKWAAAVAKTTKLIKETNLKKVVLARNLQIELAHKPELCLLWQRLQFTQPNTYHILLKQKELLFLSATPERFAKFGATYFETAAVAGTTRRGDTALEDKQLGNTLLADKKNRSEQQFVVNEINSSLKKAGLVTHHPMEPILLKNKNVQHLFTPIKGTGSYNLFSLLDSLHPTPALGGLPRKKALLQIDKIEPFMRGLFGAPIGHISFDGTGELAVGIRSGIISGTTVFLFAGAGIVTDSMPETEVAETRMKFNPILNILKEDNE